MAAKLAMPEAEAHAFWNHYRAQGWVNGNGIPCADWQALLHKWRAKWERDSVAKKPQEPGPFRSIHEAKIVEEECTKALDRIGPFSQTPKDCAERAKLLARRRFARDFIYNPTKTHEPIQKQS